MSPRFVSVLSLAFLSLSFGATASAQDVSKRIRSAVERSTLDQPGTHPFHLKATLAPSQARDAATGRTGEVEIWWSSPTVWRREVRSPEFHQVQIANGSQVWQKTDGAYFPEWLRETAVALIRPVPSLDALLERAKTADVTHLMGSTYVKWQTIGSDGTTSKGIGATFAINDESGLIFYDGDVGYGGLYSKFASFHGRQIARTVAHRSPEVTATVVKLEDLPAEPAAFFDASAPGGDAASFDTIPVEEKKLRQSLKPGPPIVWPTIGGVVNGALITEVLVDRHGDVHTFSTVVSDNPGLADAARQVIESLHFEPWLVDGKPQQVVSTLTLPFHTALPVGVEDLGTARAAFERGRPSTTLAIPQVGPHTLVGSFLAKATSGATETGVYQDIWVDAQHWHREATFAGSHLIRTRDGADRYELAEGPQANLLQFVFRIVEPVPFFDTFVESDWRMKRDVVNSAPTIRVASGYESPDGKLDPQQFRGYWFDSTGALVRAHLNGFDLSYTKPQIFLGVMQPTQIDMRTDAGLALQFHVSSVTPATTVSPTLFQISGHAVQHVLTSEVR